MNWKEMKPRERDALIAEKVMGLQVEHWTESERETVDEDGNPETWSLRTGYVVIDGLSNPYVLHYTEDMSAAWQVVEKIKQEGHRYNNSLFVQWQYHLDYLYGRPAHRDVLYDLSPEGICLAALKAVGVEIGE